MIFFRDLRFASRALWRRPAAPIAVVVTLALGIGLNTSMFSVAESSLLRSLPFPDADRLLTLYTIAPAREGEEGGKPRLARWSFPEYRLVRDRLRTVHDLAIYDVLYANLRTAGGPERVTGEEVSASYFRALRIGPLLGRVFSEAEDAKPGAAPVVVLAHGLWQRRFGGDERVLGQVVHLNGVPLTVVGVMPSNFAGLSGQAELWVPQMMAPTVQYTGHLTTRQHFMTVIGRLAPGATLTQVRAELAVAGASIATALPPVPEEWGIASATATPLADARVDPTRRASILILFGADFLVLLIACVNSANLLLARGGAVARQRELAVRIALGAGQWRIVRQQLTESVALAVGGGGVGVLLAVWGTHLLATLSPAHPPTGRFLNGQIGEFATIRLDAAVVAYTCVLALVVGIVVGVLPAWRALRTDPSESLRSGTRTAGRGLGTVRRPKIQGALILGEVTLAMVLLVGAGLLVESLLRLRAITPGFDPDGVLTFVITPPAPRYPRGTASALLERVLADVGAVPGVRWATVGPCAPFMPCAYDLVHIVGRSDDVAVGGTAKTPGSEEGVGRLYVGPDHFRVLGIPIRRGRAFTADDRAGRLGVAIVNTTAARRFWPHEDPIGKRVWFGGSSGCSSPDSAAQIVGVVGDVKYWPEDAPVGADFYTPYLQYTSPAAVVMIKTNPAVMGRGGGEGGSGQMLSALRAAVRAADPDLPLYDVETMSERETRATAPQRFTTIVLALFAALAFVLAAVGVGAVVAYAAGERTKEIGIRMAMGATRMGIVGMVARDAMALAGAGIAAGVVAALALAQVLRGVLYGVSATEPAIYLAVGALLAAAALVACVVPAARSAKVDIVRALRAE